MKLAAFMVLVVVLVSGCSQRSPEGPQSSDPQELNRLGVQYLRQGQVDEAIRAFRYAVERKPDYPEALHNLGMALIKKGQYKEAIKGLEKAAQITPESPDTLMALALAYQLSGEKSKAAVIFTRASQLSNQIEARRTPFMVQVAAKEDLGEAIALANRLSDRYEPGAKISRVEINGKTFYRVRIGAGSRAAAEALSERLRGEEGSEPWIIRTD